MKHQVAAGLMDATTISLGKWMWWWILEVLVKNYGLKVVMAWLLLETIVWRQPMLELNLLVLKKKLNLLNSDNPLRY